MDDDDNVDDTERDVNAMTAANNGMRQYIRLLFAGIFSMCGIWWFWQIVAILMGLLGSNQLAVHVLYDTLLHFYYMIPTGIGLAGASRVGALIGQNKIMLAKRLGNSILGITLLEATFLAVLTFILKTYILQLFTSDASVMSIAVKMAPLFCTFVILDAMQGVSQCILRGIKQQSKYMFGVFAGPWLVAIPLGCLLAFVPEIEWKVFGMWTGNNAGYIVMVSWFLYLWIKYDWNEQKEEVPPFETDPLLKESQRNNEVTNVSVVAERTVFV